MSLGAGGSQGVGFLGRSHYSWQITRALYALILMALCLACWVGDGAAAERRVALVIGNGSYESQPELANPPNDAKDVAEALKSLGFEVRLELNLGKDRMTKTIAEFGEAAKNANVSLFYYGGHGLQLSEQNYLVPVDAELRKLEDIDVRTVRLNEVLHAFGKGGGVHLVFLDACREDPAKGAVLQAGLARVGKAAGFLVAFSTQPNSVAFDGGGRNSPFAQALLAHIATPGADISTVMISARKDVLAATGGEQIPYEEDALTTQFYFAGETPPAASQETTLWQLAARANDASLLQAYLALYPDGPHAADIKSLTDKILVATGNPSNQTPKQEEMLWSLARSLRREQLVDDYLQTFPDGAHSSQARELLASLHVQDQEGQTPEVVCERLATHPNDSTASLRGVDLPTLTSNSSAAMEACASASTRHPESTHYVALLARAKFAAGRFDDSIKLYKDAADRGDTRAMVSLGLLLKSGDHLSKDVPAAHALFQKAAERGSLDGALDLAVDLLAGTGGPKDPQRAVSLLKQASASGSARATYNLAVLASQGQADDVRSALGLFRQAANLGYSEGYRAAAVLLDEGRGIPADPKTAADELLRAIAEDAGQATKDLTSSTQRWTPETVSAIQLRLKSAGYYHGEINGRTGPGMAQALEMWRRQGDPRHAAGEAGTIIKN